MIVIIVHTFPYPFHQLPPQQNPKLTPTQIHKTTFIRQSPISNPSLAPSSPPPPPQKLYYPYNMSDQNDIARTILQESTATTSAAT